jgi:dipeptidyl aminopeptidase/acylaminoacyl peptidase
MRRLLITWVVLAIALGLTVAHAQTPTWKVVEYRFVNDLIGTGYALHQARLSPDGAMIAIPDPKQGMCLYRFATKGVTCTPWPDSDERKFRPGGSYSTYSWSPDSQYIAFTESLFDFFLESDLWLYDVATGEFSNRTNDNVYSDVLRSQEQKPPLDYLPMWNPANGDLYFFRSFRAQDQITSELFLFPLKRETPKSVRDITEPALPTWSVFRPAAIAPDGNAVALIALASKRGDPKSGIWLLNLKDGRLDQIATVDDFKNGLPAWAKEDNRSALWPEAIAWANNGGLLIRAIDAQFATGSVGYNAFYLDVAARKLTPLADFSDIPDRAALFKLDENDTSPQMRMPRAAAAAPDGSAVLYIQMDISRRGAISMLPLPLDGSKPVQLATIDEFKVSQAATAPPQMSADGKALLWGYLVQFSKQ